MKIHGIHELYMKIERQIVQPRPSNASFPLPHRSFERRHVLHVFSVLTGTLLDVYDSCIQYSSIFAYL